MADQLGRCPSAPGPEMGKSPLALAGMIRG